MRKTVVTHPVVEALHDKLLDGLEFCRLTYSLFDQVVNAPNGSHVLRQRRGPIKELVEELLPICRYIQTYYGVGQYISVRWVYGNQSFDAKLESTGQMVERGAWPATGTIEVTQAVHEKEYLARELLNTEGFAFGVGGIALVKDKCGHRKIESIPTVYTNQSYLDDMCSIVLGAIGAKAQKFAKGVYPQDTTLIVDCDLMTLFLQDEWDRLIAMVRKELPTHGFKQVFLTAQSGSFTATL